MINENVLITSMCVFILVTYLIAPTPDIIFKLYKNDSFDKDFDEIKLKKCKI